jgi:hypothetical protein
MNYHAMMDRICSSFGLSTFYFRLFLPSWPSQGIADGGHPDDYRGEHDGLSILRERQGGGSREEGGGKGRRKLRLTVQRGRNQETKQETLTILCRRFAFPFCLLLSAYSLGSCQLQLFSHPQFSSTTLFFTGTLFLTTAPMGRIEITTRMSAATNCTGTGIISAA